MAGISQVWLTEKELEASVHALETLGEGTDEAPPFLTEYEKAALAKFKAALEPVACKV